MRLPLTAGAYEIERGVTAYTVVDTGSKDPDGRDRRVARCEFHDEASRIKALHAAIRTALDLNETRAKIARETKASSC